MHQLRNLFLPALLVPFMLSAQATFPPLEGENALGKTIHLPTRGEWSIMAVVAGKKAQPLLEEWFAPAYNRFVMKSGLFASSYNVNLYLVPVFTGLDKAAYGPSMNALKKKVDADLAKQVVFFKGDEGPLMDALGIKDKGIPYFFTVDPQGKIVQRESGKFSVEKLDALEAPLL
ncbi:MAG: hypothetical protein JST38_18535 [Bacteroidetes bacterium]|nr:hypothetical protein [Bacteroidota bacterium]MBS1942866.1 hypothetical protein [Bacteroidota bacterium]